MLRRSLLLGAAFGLATVGVSALGVRTAHARSSLVSPYPQPEVWPTAIRFLRIDRGATIREKDEGSGYVLFEYPEGGKKYKGSLELIRTSDAVGREATQLVMTLPDLPRHFETMLLDKLSEKVREERGAPAPPPPRQKPAPTKPAGKPDAGDPLPRLPTYE